MPEPCAVSTTSRAIVSRPNPATQTTAHQWTMTVWPRQKSGHGPRRSLWTTGWGMMRNNNLTAILSRMKPETHCRGESCIRPAVPPPGDHKDRPYLGQTHAIETRSRPPGRLHHKTRGVDTRGTPATLPHAFVKIHEIEAANHCHGLFVSLWMLPL